ncbi:MAG: hypothetical protein OEU93_18680 [Rubrivivax sp.]|nr:hypothetical protein [Rubrivivax sp.]
MAGIRLPMAGVQVLQTQRVAGTARRRCMGRISVNVGAIGTTDRSDVCCSPTRIHAPDPLPRQLLEICEPQSGLWVCGSLNSIAKILQALMR